MKLLVRVSVGRDDFSSQVVGYMDEESKGIAAIKLGLRVIDDKPVARYELPGMSEPIAVGFTELPKITGEGLLHQAASSLLAKLDKYSHDIAE